MVLPLSLAHLHRPSRAILFPFSSAVFLHRRYGAQVASERASGGGALAEITNSLATNNFHSATVVAVTPRTSYVSRMDRVYFITYSYDGDHYLSTRVFNHVARNARAKRRPL